MTPLSSALRWLVVMVGEDGEDLSSREGGLSLSLALPLSQGIMEDTDDG